MSETLVRPRALDTELDVQVPAQSGGSTRTSQPAVPAARHSGESGEGLSFAELMDRLSGEVAAGSSNTELPEQIPGREPAPLFTPAGPRAGARHAAPLEEAPRVAEAPAGLTGSFFRGALAEERPSRLAGLPLPRSPKVIAAVATTAVLGATAVLTGAASDPGSEVAQASGDSSVRLAAADAVLPGLQGEGSTVDATPAAHTVQAGPGVMGGQMQAAMGQAMGSLPSVFDKADAARIAAVAKADAEKAAADQRANLAKAARSAAGGASVGDVIGQVAGSSVGAKALAAARTRLGMPYVWGATGPNSFDCSGLTQWAFKQVGISLPRTSSAQSTFGTAVSKDQLQPGDLVFFYTPVSHVGIYVGNGQVLHASTSGEPVKISSMSSFPFHNARRIL
jgi:peptidoglycan DL-endopeptidase CwlO